jgi:hypothetical protein
MQPDTSDATRCSSDRLHNVSDIRGLPRLQLTPHQLALIVHLECACLAHSVLEHIAQEESSQNRCHPVLHQGVVPRRRAQPQSREQVAITHCYECNERKLGNVDDCCGDLTAGSERVVAACHSKILQAWFIMNGLFHLLIGLGVTSSGAEGDVHAISCRKASKLLASDSNNLQHSINKQSDSFDSRRTAMYCLRTAELVGRKVLHDPLTHSGTSTNTGL